MTTKRLPQLDDRRLPHRRRARDHPHLRRRPRPARLRRLHPARRRRGRRALVRYFEPLRRDRRARRRRHRARDADVAGQPRLGRPARLRRRASSPPSTATRSNCSRHPRPARDAGDADRDQRLHRPRGDGYQAGAPDDAPTRPRGYHSAPGRTFAGDRRRPGHGDHHDLRRRGDRRRPGRRGGGMPVVISFTVETDGRLPSGQRSATPSSRSTPRPAAYPAYYMVNCAHPTHFADVLDGAPAWPARLGGLRANASHAEPRRARRRRRARRGRPGRPGRALPALRAHCRTRVLGGCCGTDATCTWTPSPKRAWPRPRSEPRSANLRPTNLRPDHPQPRRSGRTAGHQRLQAAGGFVVGRQPGDQALVAVVGQLQHLVSEPQVADVRVGQHLVPRPSRRPGGPPNGPRTRARRGARRPARRSRASSPQRVAARRQPADLLVGDDRHSGYTGGRAGWRNT